MLVLSSLLCPVSVHFASSNTRVSLFPLSIDMFIVRDWSLFSQNSETISLSLFWWISASPLFRGKFRTRTRETTFPDESEHTAKPTLMQTLLSLSLFVVECSLSSSHSDIPCSFDRRYFGEEKKQGRQQRYLDNSRCQADEERKEVLRVDVLVVPVCACYCSLCPGGARLFWTCVKSIEFDAFFLYILRLLPVISYYSSLQLSLARLLFVVCSLL